MKTTKYLLTTVCALALGAVSASAASRIWTDVQGRKVDATFVKLEGSEIVLQTAQGNVYKFELSKLSAADQEAVKTMRPAEETSLELNALPAKASVKLAASRIDELVAAGLIRGNQKMGEAAIKKAEEDRKAGKPLVAFTPVKMNPPCTDDQFVRRLYLDVVGRIPTYEETNTFLRNSSQTKRADLIDKLLVSDGYTSNAFNYFADMLRIKDNFDGNNRVRGFNYEQWLKDNIAANTPWDKMVTEMVTAEGKVWNNGAAGYLLRDAGMPLDNLANTLNVFLGTDVACAQCHDHPFAEWTQKQFYQMAAFFGATSTIMRDGGDNQKRLIKDITEQLKKQGMDDIAVRRQVQQINQNAIRPNQTNVHDVGAIKTALPFDYKYKDGQPNEKVMPKLITWSAEDKDNPIYIEAEEQIGGGKPEEARKVFAKWMTDKRNPRFAMTIANRLWARAFGVGLTASVRSIDNVDESYNPDLIKHLSKEMGRVGFDMREFQRILYNTQTYQREATTAALAMGEPYYFQGPMLRRMSAEQAWDSYLTLVMGNVDKVKNTRADSYGRAIDMDLEKTTVQTLGSKLKALADLEKREQEKLGGSLASATATTVKNAKAGKKEEETMMDDEKIVTFGGKGKDQLKLMRASELEQPARGGHFLADFGQSPRLVIDGSSKAGSVPQVLSMMNGEAQMMLTSPDSLIHANLKKLSPADKAEAIFLTVLNRRCTLREKDIAKKEIQAHGEQAYSNMIWALINSREFFFIQ